MFTFYQAYILFSFYYRVKDRVEFLFFCNHWESLKLFCNGQCLFLRSDASQTSVDWCKTYNRYKAKYFHRMLSSYGMLLEWQSRVVPGSIHKSLIIIFLFFLITFFYFSILIYLNYGQGQANLKLGLVFTFNQAYILCLLYYRVDQRES